MGKAVPLLKSLIIPIIVLILSMAVINGRLIADLAPQTIPLIVLAAIIISMGLSIGFKKSRFFFVLLIISLNFVFQVSYADPYYSRALLLMLLPLNIFLISLLTERGIISLWGKIQFGLIFFQLVVIFWLIKTGGVIQLNSLQAQYALTNSLLAYPVLQFMAAGFFAVVITILSIWRFDRPDGLFIGLIAAVCMGFYLPDSPTMWPFITFACAVMIILETVKDMYRFAFMDELTGLYSRRCLNQDQLKLSGTYTIAMLDIDHFKNFNDTYGHDVGDQVLRYVASLMMRAPGGGKAYRYGGEEFTMVFAGKSKDEALPYLEQLRETMSTRPFTLRSKDRPNKKPKTKTPSNRKPKKVAVTMSIGVADNEKKNAGPDDVIKAADKALYKAKKSGRNRVCI